MKQRFDIRVGGVSTGYPYDPDQHGETAESDAIAHAEKLAGEHVVMKVEVVTQAFDYDLREWLDVDSYVLRHGAMVTKD